LDGVLKLSGAQYDRLFAALEADRLAELREEVMGMRIATDASGTSRVASQKITELLAAETELARKKAKVEQARRVRQSGGNIEELPEVMASSVITTLRAQQSEIMRKMQPLPSQRDIVALRPHAIRAQEALRAIEGQISAEVDRIIANLENDYAASRNQVDGLRQELALNKLKELQQSKTRQEPEARIILRLMANAGLLGRRGFFRWATARHIVPCTHREGADPSCDQSGFGAAWR
jgi:uncharacterized protein involved in exopolysaccharide biosynthesis